MDEESRQHLGLIQGVVDRLAGNSMTMKGMSLTIASGLIAFAVSTKQPTLTLVALLPVVGFWVLDAYYLWQETIFRHLYNEVCADTIKNPAVVSDFRMQCRTTTGQTWLGAMKRSAVSVLHGGLMAAVILGIWLLPSKSEPTPQPTRVQLDDTVRVILIQFMQPAPTAIDSESVRGH